MNKLIILIILSFISITSYSEDLRILRNPEYFSISPLSIRGESLVCPNGFLPRSSADDGFTMPLTKFNEKYKINESDKIITESIQWKFEELIAESINKSGYSLAFLMEANKSSLNHRDPVQEAQAMIKGLWKSSAMKILTNSIAYGFFPRTPNNSDLVIDFNVYPSLSAVTNTKINFSTDRRDVLLNNLNLINVNRLPLGDNTRGNGNMVSHDFKTYAVGVRCLQNVIQTTKLGFFSANSIPNKYGEIEEKGYFVVIYYNYPLEPN
jgi:hypothetical protein